MDGEKVIASKLVVKSLMFIIKKKLVVRISIKMARMMTRKR